MQLEHDLYAARREQKPDMTTESERGDKANKHTDIGYLQNQHTKLEAEIKLSLTSWCLHGRQRGRAEGRRHHQLQQSC